MLKRENTKLKHPFSAVFPFVNSSVPVWDPPEQVQDDRAQTHNGEPTQWVTPAGWKPPKGHLNGSVALTRPGDRWWSPPSSSRWTPLRSSLLHTNGRTGMMHLGSVLCPLKNKLTNHPKYLYFCFSDTALCLQVYYSDNLFEYIQSPTFHNFYFSNFRVLCE